MAKWFVSFCVIVVALALYGGHIAKKGVETQVLEKIAAFDRKGVKAKAADANLDVVAGELVLRNVVIRDDDWTLHAQRVVLPVSTEDMLRNLLAFARMQMGHAETVPAFPVSNFVAHDLRLDVEDEKNFFKIATLSMENFHLPASGDAVSKDDYAWIYQTSFGRFLLKDISGAANIAEMAIEGKEKGRIAKISVNGFSINEMKSSLSLLQMRDCRMPSPGALDAFLLDPEKVIEKYFGSSFGDIARRLRDVKAFPCAEIFMNDGRLAFMVNESPVHVTWDEAGMTCENKDGASCTQSVRNLSVNTDVLRQFDVPLRHVPERVFLNFDFSAQASSNGSMFTSRTSVQGLFTSAYEVFVNPEMQTPRIKRLSKVPAIFCGNL